MDEAVKRITEGLEQAIQAEIEGQHFYRMAANGTEDEKGREVFLALAREEHEHASFLRAQYRSFRETGRADASVKLGKPVSLAGGSPIFSDGLRARIQSAHHEMTALSIGAQLELNAVHFYQGEADATDDETVKSFYEELVAWEQGHYDGLTRQLEDLRQGYFGENRFAPF